MIDSNKDKEYERNSKSIKKIENFFRLRHEATMVKSEWKKMNHQL